MHKSDKSDKSHKSHKSDKSYHFEARLAARAAAEEEPEFHARLVEFDARGLFSLLLVSKLVLSELFRVHKYSRAAWSGLEWF